MKLLFLLMIIVQWHLPKERKVEESIKGVLNSYVDSLAAQQDDKFFFIVRLERRRNGGQFVFVKQETSLWSTLEHGVPDAYSQYNQQLVFWFSEKSNQQFDSKLRAEFVRHFAPMVGLDSIATMGWEPQPFRFTLTNKGRIESACRICEFPYPGFFKDGYMLDDEGNQMYRDGTYDACSLYFDGPYALVSPMEYLDLNKVGESLPLTGLGAVMVIDEYGMVVSVELHGEELKTLSSGVKSQVIELLKKMPKWNQGRLRGKPVKYRIHVGL